MSVEVDIEQPYETLVGEVIASRYHIESRIGEGAMGAVYRAKHVKVGRAFAVKILHPRLLEDAKQLQRFEREAELAGRLRHPNVIGVVDVGETHNGLRYMVMDFAEGPDLASMLSEAPMPPQRVVNLTRQMLEGLFHAHEQGLIHRDFKPENVIVERDAHGDEVPRIVDFGIAILREGGESASGPGRLTTNGLVLGTPHYMAPEQAVADPIDHRIDLFALGIMVYEMLCGKLPFDGSGAEVARANLLLDPPPIAQRVPYLDVDPLLEAFARRLMAKKREQRPATAKAARELLDLIQRDRDAAAAALGVPLDAARAPATTQPSAPVRHHRADDNGTFPPPVRSAVETPPQAPPLKDPRAVASRPDQKRISTLTDPATRTRTPLIVGALFGAAIVGGGVFFAMNGRDKHDARSAEVATTAPTPSPITTQPIETKPIETNPAPVEVKPASVETPPAPVETPPAPVEEPKPIAKTQPKTAKVTKTAKTTKTTQPATLTSIAQKPPEPPSAPVDTAPKQLDVNAFAQKYKAVGAALNQLQQDKGADAASDLWARYRMIRFADAVATQPKRDEAAQILNKLSNDIATRRK